MNFQKVIIIGSGGSGKSTLSYEISKKFDLPITHLDKVFWRPDWEPIGRDLLEAKLREVLQSSKWIIEGNYDSTLEMRLEKADTVIFLDFNRLTCISRVIKRYFMYRGKTRPDMGEGCQEKIDYIFLRWLWRFPKDTRPRMLELLNKYPDINLITLKTPKEVKEFLHTSL